MLDQYFKDLDLLDFDFMVVDPSLAGVSESIYKKFFNRKKLAVFQWCSLNNEQTLYHFFDNVHSHIIEQLINDEEYFFCFQSDAEGWNQVRYYVPLCASAATYGIPFDKLVFCTGNLDVKQQYETYSKRSGFSPPIKIIAYDHFLASSARFMEEMAVDPGSSEYWKFYDVEQYFDKIYKHRLQKIKPDNIFLHLSRVCRDHRIYFNYLADKSQNRRYYHLSQDKLHYKTIANINNNIPISREDLANWIKKLPLIVDTRKFHINYGTYDDKFFKLYANYLINVAGETNWRRNLFYSEKTYKPVMAMMPFVVYGNLEINKKLTDLEFKLYDNLFDYSWDSEVDDIKRIEKLYAECENFLKRFKNYSHEERVNSIILKEKDTIIHNYETLLKYATTVNIPLITVNL